MEHTFFGKIYPAIGSFTEVANIDQIIGSGGSQFLLDPKNHRLFVTTSHPTPNSLVGIDLNTGEVLSDVIVKDNTSPLEFDTISETLFVITEQSPASNGHFTSLFGTINPETGNFTLITNLGSLGDTSESALDPINHRFYDLLEVITRNPSSRIENRLVTIDTNNGIVFHHSHAKQWFDQPLTCEC